jgi:GT2 family glycosyltransferase
VTSDVSVLIPTSGRASLRRVLDSLAGQELDGVRPELVVAANGPDAGAAVDGMLERFPWPARTVERRSPGIGAARNAALAAASAPLTLMINDDIVPAGEDWLAGHVRAHRGEAGARTAVLGPVTWAPVPPPTRVMHWMADQGMMNSYENIAAGRPAPGEFYASNTSVPRALLEAAGGFDEALDGYGWEEYDLSLRLHDLGMVVEWHAELVVRHHHVYTLKDSLRRMEAIGEATRAFNAKHAGREGLVTPHPSAAKVAIGRAIAPIATRIPVPDAMPEAMARPALWLAHQAALARGYAARRSR